MNILRLLLTIIYAFWLYDLNSVFKQMWIHTAVMKYILLCNTCIFTKTLWGKLWEQNLHSTLHPYIKRETICFAHTIQHCTVSYFRSNTLYFAKLFPFSFPKKQKFYLPKLQKRWYSINRKNLSLKRGSLYELQSFAVFLREFQEL